MTTVTLEVASGDAVTRHALGAFAGRKQGHRISFATPELLWRVLTAKRWEMLKAMTGIGPLGLRQLARLLGRDVKAVHRDAHALLDAGILERTDDGRLEFPYDAVRVEFELKAA